MEKATNELRRQNQSLKRQLQKLLIENQVLRAVASAVTNHKVSDWHHYGSRLSIGCRVTAAMTDPKIHSPPVIGHGDFYNRAEPNNARGSVVHCRSLDTPSKIARFDNLIATNIQGLLLSEGDIANIVEKCSWARSDDLL
jgi:hypothetical protein